MKAIFLNLTLFLITVTIAKGQIEGKYYSSEEDTPKFIGTWIAKFNEGTVKIILVSKPHQYNEQLKVYMDKVEGTYSIIDKRNRVLYENEKNYRIEDGYVDYNDKNVLNATYVDRVIYMVAIATLKFDPKTKSLHLNLVNTNEGALTFTAQNEKKQEKKYFKIPKDIILIKNSN